MLRATSLASATLAALLLTGCVAPVGPVQVTRFHLPDTSALGGGTISVEPAEGMDGSSLEQRSYQAAVGRQLTLLGYTEVPAGKGAQIAQVRVERTTYRPERTNGPVSVGMGGSTGGYYGSGVGMGVGIDLSGRPAEQVETRLGVSIKDRAKNTVLWEGRAGFSVSAKSPQAQTQLGAAKMAEALFKGFPGTSGETISVK